MSEADDEKHDRLPLELRVLVMVLSYRLVDLFVKPGAILHGGHSGVPCVLGKHSAEEEPESDRLSG